MNSDPLADVVTSQYEQWVYPEPIVDLPAWLSSNWQWFDPSHSHLMFWPDRAYKPDMDILIAGCGTNQGAVFAYTNPDAKVVAIDVSQASLNHHQHLKDKYELSNLELYRLPIEDVGSLGRDYDLIVSTGVLHHLAEPEFGMRSLASCLRQDGVAAIMLYARYGRLGVEMMQSVFRDMGFRQTESSVQLVRDALSAVPEAHPVRTYMGLAPDLRFDAGLVDTFLHGRDRSYTIGECIKLVETAGLVFQDLFIKAPYYPPAHSASAFFASVEMLAEEMQWSIMERIHFRNACHFFTACRSDRPRETYKIDLTADVAQQLVPSFRKNCRLQGDKLARYDWSMPLDAAQLAIVREIDGQRTAAEIIAAAAQVGESIAADNSDVAPVDMSFFRLLWRLDFLAMRLNRVARKTAGEVG